MNTKEKLLFISSKQYVEKLHEQNLDYENHNRLFFCHLAALSFLTTGISEFHLDLTYNYVVFGSDLEEHALGLKIDNKLITFITTGHSLITLNNHCTRSSLRLNNHIFGSVRCYNFKECIEKYLDTHIKYPHISLEQYKNTTFNVLFLKFKIYNRKSDESQKNFLQLLYEQCPEIDYFLNYIKTKDHFHQKSIVNQKTIVQIKTLKI